MAPKFGTSGLRGLVTELTPALVADYTRAFLAVTEAGLPGVEMTTWYGLFVTAGTPKAVVDRLYAETMKALAQPDVQKRLVGLGGEPGNATQGEFAAMVRADYDRFGKLIRDANVKLDQ